MSADLAEVLALAEAIAVEGPQGKPGEKGDKGDPGRDGADGRDGVVGAKGDRGPNGLQGPPGRPGADGVDGVDGRTGPEGRPGRAGRDGIDGKPGERGPRGAQGEPGRDGKDGKDGRDGVWRGGSGSAALQLLADGVPIAPQVRALDLLGLGVGNIDVDGPAARLDLASLIPPGVTGDVNYVFTQNVPATVWDIAHGLGKRPSVTVVDSGGTTVEGDVTYLDNNNLRLNFTAPFAGACYLN